MTREEAYWAGLKPEDFYDENMSSLFTPAVARPEWVASSVTDTIRFLELIRDKKLPEVLHGAFLRTSALRLLRCVYGSDEQSAEAVASYVAGREEELEQLAKEYGIV